MKLAIGNWAGWKQNRKRVPDSRVRTPLQHTDVHQIIKLLHADTCSRSHTDKPLTLAAGFLMFTEKNGNIVVLCSINFALYKNIVLMALI